MQITALQHAKAVTSNTADIQPPAPLLTEHQHCCCKHTHSHTSSMSEGSSSVQLARPASAAAAEPSRSDAVAAAGLGANRSSSCASCPTLRPQCVTLSLYLCLGTIDKPRSTACTAWGMMPACCPWPQPWMSREPRTHQVLNCGMLRLNKSCGTGVNARCDAAPSCQLLLEGQALSGSKE